MKYKWNTNAGHSQLQMMYKGRGRLKDTNAGKDKKRPETEMKINEGKKKYKCN